MKTFILGFIALLSLCQCGYNWGHSTRQLPDGYKTVFIEMFQNQSQLVGLEAQFSRALTQLFQRSGFAVVENKEAAELIIQGDIFNAEVVGGASIPSFVAKNYSSPDVTQRTSTRYQAPFFSSYTVRVSVNIKAIRSRDKQLIWQTTQTGAETFQGSRLKRQGLRSSNVLYNQARKKETVKTIARDMMNDVFDRLTENF
jgi:hypothetical protein